MLFAITRIILGITIFIIGYFLIGKIKSINALSFSGCSYISYKDYCTKEDYLNIWELEGVRYDAEVISPQYL